MNLLKDKRVRAALLALLAALVYALTGVQVDNRTLESIDSAIGSAVTATAE